MALFGLARATHISTPSPSWKSHWCVQLVRVKLLRVFSTLSGGFLLIELSGGRTCCLISPGTSSPSFRTSNTGCPRSSSLQQSHGNKLVSVFVFMEPLSSRGHVLSAPKTPTTHTPVSMRLTDGRTLPFSYSNPCNVTSLHGISIQLDQCQHFQNIPKQHTQHHSFTEFTWIPDALTHFT